MATFSDDEYGRVARALLFPPYRKQVVGIGFMFGVDQLGYALDAKLQQLSESAKADVLALADRILTAVREKHDAVTGCGTPDVTRVGEIQKNAQFGQQVRAREIDDMRAELALLTDHYVNPRAAGSSVGGGINGTWTP